MGMRAGGFFHEKIDANDMKYRVFERMDVFSTKYGYERGWFFLEYGRFYKKMGIRAMVFSLKKYETKITSYWLLLVPDMA